MPRPSHVAMDHTGIESGTALWNGEPDYSDTRRQLALQIIGYTGQSDVLACHNHVDETLLAKKVLDDFQYSGTGQLVHVIFALELKGVPAVVKEYLSIDASRIRRVHDSSDEAELSVYCQYAREMTNLKAK